MDQLVVQQLLVAEYRRIHDRNPSYTRRSFARKIGISSSALSEILGSKRRVSKKLAERILDRLELPASQKATVLNLFEAKRAQSKLSNARRLCTDEYQLIAEWHHFAILSLLETEGARVDVRWIARQLRITIQATEESLARLIRLGLLLIKKDGSHEITYEHITTSDEVTCQALRRAHRNNLVLARRSLDRDPLSVRDFTAITMAIDPERLPAAKQVIREFRDNLATLLESGRKKKVYKLCIQLFPLPQEEGF